jgi:Ca2+-binding RTX toxin-like protein
MNSRWITIPGLSLALAAMLLSVPSSLALAGEGATCEYKASNHRVKVIVNYFADIKRTIGDHISVNDVWCGRVATVYNTDSIVILGGADDQAVSLHLDYGGFRPGFTDEPGASDEIEISVSLGGDADTVQIYGGGADSNIVIGKSSGLGVKGKMNLSYNETSGIDADLTMIIGIEQVIVFGEGGQDVISGAGGSGTGDPANFILKLAGGDGGDTVTGGAVTDSIIGGDGPDVLKGAAGPDIIDAIDTIHGNDAIYGGNGSDSCSYDVGDAVTSCP